MKIKPVEIKPAPKYPDKYNAELQRVLTASRPYRWLGTPLAAGVLTAAVALSVSACNANQVKYGGFAPLVSGGDPAPIIGTGDIPKSRETASLDNVDITEDIFDYITMGEVAPFKTWQYTSAIPLFEYGEGTGTIGCESITAPVFMSEEEAFAILSAAFADAGMTLSRGAETLEQAQLPVTNMYDYGNEKDRYPTKQGDLAPDGFLETVCLPVEFISRGDVEDWQGDTNTWSSVSGYNMIKTARTLADNNDGVAVFYDPVTFMDYSKWSTPERGDDESDEEFYARWDEARLQGERRAMEESERLLRLQAESLISWLRAEGLF